MQDLPHTLRGALLPEPSRTPRAGQPAGPEQDMRSAKRLAPRRGGWRRALFVEYWTIHASWTSFHTPSGDRPRRWATTNRPSTLEWEIRVEERVAPTPSSPPGDGGQLLGIVASKPPGRVVVHHGPAEILLQAWPA